MTMANCLIDDLKAVKVLLDQMEELTEQIGETDLDVYETALSEQRAIIINLGALIAPVELELNKYTKACRKLHAEADDEAKRAGISRLATLTSPGGEGPGQAPSLEPIKCPTFSGRLADYSTFKENWN